MGKSTEGNEGNEEKRGCEPRNTRNTRKTQRRKRARKKISKQFKPTFEAVQRFLFRVVRVFRGKIFWLPLGVLEIY
jgi:hypothetical protein